MPQGALPITQPHGADDERVRAQYRYWQKRILIGTIVGYAIFYIVRKNLAIAMPLMERDLGITKAQLGLFLTLHGLLYGCSKFLNGVAADRLNARWFMVAGLTVCAGLNFGFGLSSTALAFGIWWMLNGWFQGMGHPPCARLMTHWYPPDQLALKMGIWNTSHAIGGGLVLVLCAYLAPLGWRACFNVPAIIALTGAAVLAWGLRDTPESMGLPPVEGTDHTDANKAPVLETLLRLVLRNPYIWLLAAANFFVYIVRYGLLDWGPTFLNQARGVTIAQAGWITAAYEIAGIFGMISSGWITDRYCGGRGGRTCLFFMIGCALTLLAFWAIPVQGVLLCGTLMSLAGFFIYGPIALVGIAAANLGTKHAAATAGGLTGFFGYLSTTISGVGVGWLVQHHGWDAGFLSFLVAAILGIVLFAFLWTAPPHGYAGDGGKKPNR